MVIISFAVLLVCVNIVRIRFAKTAEEQGDNAYKQGNYDLAISAYTRANNLIFWNREKKADILYFRGCSYYEKDDFSMAIVDFTKTIKLYSEDENYYIMRALMYEKIHNYELAIIDFSKAIELFGEYTYLEVPHYFLDIYFFRANVYRLNKDYALAIADYDYIIHVIDKNINNPETEDKDEINKLVKRRDNAVSQKGTTERMIEIRPKIIGTLSVNVYPDEPDTYEYEFLSVDTKNTSEIIMLLEYVINEYPKIRPLHTSSFLTLTRIVENNTELSQNIIDKMKQVNANVCISTAFKDFLVMNLLLPNGTYTTVFFE